MANLTVTIDDELLHRARQRALRQGTSVNALIREYLTSFADTARIDEARDNLVSLSRRTHAGSGHGGRQWTRDELHER